MISHGEYEDPGLYGLLNTQGVPPAPLTPHISARPEKAAGGAINVAISSAPEQAGVEEEEDGEAMARGAQEKPLTVSRESAETRSNHKQRRNPREGANIPRATEEKSR